jgi:hypothetical protein
MTWMAWAACGKASPLATAVTFSVRCSRRPWPVSRGVAGDRHLAPGQGLELGVQAGLVAFDGEDVVRAAAGRAASVPALGMQRGQHRDFVGLRLDPNLAEHHAVGVVQGGEEVPAILAASGRAA